MTFKVIEDKDFNKYAKHFNEKNFFQTKQMGDYFISKGKKIYYFGVFEKDKCLALAMVNEAFSFLGKKSFDCIKGYLIDFQNIKLMDFFTKSIFEYLKSEKIFRLTIDPNYVLIQRDINGQEVDGGINNTNLIKEFNKIGFTKSKIDYQTRVNFCLDINGQSIEELHAKFQPNTKNIINKCINKYKLEVKTIGYDDLPTFWEITQMTSQKKNFNGKNLEYYQRMYKAFKDDVVFNVCYLDGNKYLNNLKLENKEIEEKISKLSDSKANDNKRKDYNIIIENNKKNLIKYADLKDKVIPVACAMFMLYGDEVVYLFSGSNPDYMNFNGQYLVQYNIISYACEHGYRRYNFFGIKNYDIPDSDGYGVYLFKKGFNGYVEELFGQYEFIKKGIVGLLYKVFKR